MELYNEEQIRVILENYRDLSTNELFREYVFDLSNALKTNLLTPQIRLLVFCRYNLQLNIMQCLQVMCVDYQQYQELEQELLEILEYIMNGYLVKDRFEQVLSNSLKSLLLEVQTRNIDPLTPITKVMQIELLFWLAMNHDPLAQNAIGNRQDNRPYESSAAIKIYEEAEPSQKKNASNDQFYNKDLKNNVAYGDKALSNTNGKPYKKI